MGNDKLVLLDGTEIAIISSEGIEKVHVTVESIGAACSLWEKLTQENLKQVTIKTADDEVVGEYPDMVLDHIEGKENKDGTIQVTLSLRRKTREEILEERIAVLEAGQRTQDEAIGDLGQAVSDMSEGSV